MSENSKDALRAMCPAPQVMNGLNLYLIAMSGEWPNFDGFFMVIVYE